MLLVRFKSLFNLTGLPSRFSTYLFLVQFYVGDCVRFMFLKIVVACCAVPICLARQFIRLMLPRLSRAW